MPSTAIRIALMIVVAVAGTMLIQSGVSARTITVKACTDSQVANHVTDAYVISCTGKGGQVKCGEGGLVVCCKTDSAGKRVCARNPDNLPLTDNPSSRPPHVRTDPGPGRVSPPPMTVRPPRAEPSPGRVSPPQNPTRPPRADPPPGRVGPPASKGPSIK